LHRPLTLWDGTGDDAVAYYYNATTQATQWEKPGGVDFDSAAVTKPQASAGAPEYPEYPEYPVYPVRCRVGFGRLPRAARRDALPSVWSLQDITQIDQAAVAHRDAPAGAVASEPPGAAAAHGTAPRAGQGARGREGGVICEATAWGGVCRRSWRANGRRRRRRTASRASPH
jgi:hypothetical protein